jgi:hypothetical protein
MIVIASISLSFAVIAVTFALVLSVGAAIFLSGLVHGGTERRIRRFTDAEGTFSQRVDAADRRPRFEPADAAREMKLCLHWGAAP